jgi:hypothetical protein
MEYKYDCSIDEVLGEGFPGRIVKAFSHRRRLLLYLKGTFSMELFHKSRFHFPARRLMYYP